ncbi:MAG: acetylglutamate kinase [Candidatus Obscuribacterales bacterium]|nr:acetylglutamate kinase [Cyanobacteria bacterium SZAS LIN-5]RTL36606.1 MAG: acetylglutamate kinase [Candidatus Melainabacteria bacterium]
MTLSTLKSSTSSTLLFASKSSGDREMLNSMDGKVVIVKFGGNSIGNEAVFDSLIEDTIELLKMGVKVIVVHGGGTAVNDALAAIGKKTEKINGLRVTDSETLEIAVKTFMTINEMLTEKLRQRGIQSLSFCSNSANPIITKKMQMEDKDGKPVDLGWVGEIVSVESASLESWLWAGWVPIISPIGRDLEGNYYNINADHAALAVATHLQADALIFCTDVPGVMKDLKDPSTRIGHLTVSDAQKCIDEGTISGGMLPKIKSCMGGIQGGVDKIAILNSFEPHALLNGFKAPQEHGTLITADPVLEQVPQ